MNIITFLKGFFGGFMPNEYIPNTYVLMWILTLFIVYNIYLAIKKDSRTKKMSAIVMVLGWLGLIYGMLSAFVEVANPELELAEKHFYLFAYTFGCSPSLFYAVFGNLVVKSIEFFTKPAV